MIRTFPAHRPNKTVKRAFVLLALNPKAARALPFNWLIRAHKQRDSDPTDNGHINRFQRAYLVVYKKKTFIQLIIEQRVR